MFKRVSILIFVAILSMMTVAQTPATCQFTVYTLPGYSDIGATGINQYGNSVGWASTSGTLYGFVRYANGAINTYMAPGAAMTRFTRRNGQGITIGAYAFSPADGATLHGLVFYNGRWQTLDHPNTAHTYLNGINNYGSIVGYYKSSSTRYTGFKLKNGMYQDIRFPGAFWTMPEGIADNGTIVGSYRLLNADGSISIGQGFILQNGVYKKFDHPLGTGGTDVQEVNKYGVIVGNYWVDSYVQGFIYTSGQFKDVILPGAYETTVSDINQYGVISGSAVFTDETRSFTATCH
jgi:hypothetical protein